MKKLSCSLLPFVSIFIMICSANAQTSIMYRTIDNLIVTGKHITAPNQKADMHLKRSFNVLNETWGEKSDGYRATFTDHKIRYMVDYNKKGNWVSTIKSYDGTLVSPAIAKSVVSAFPGFRIVHVTQVKMGNKLVHLVKIEDCHSLKTVRVSGGELDVMESYRKE